MFLGSGKFTDCETSVAEKEEKITDNLPVLVMTPSEPGKDYMEKEMDQKPWRGRLETESASSHSESAGEERGGESLPWP